MSECPKSRYGKTGEQGIWGGTHAIDATGICQDCGMDTQAAEDYPVTHHPQNLCKCCELVPQLVAENTSLKDVIGGLVEVLQELHSICKPALSRANHKQKGK